VRAIWYERTGAALEGNLECTGTWAG